MNWDQIKAEWKDIKGRARVQWGKLTDDEIARIRGDREQLEAALHQYHYLGYRSRVGQNLQYWVSDKQGQPLGCVVFGAPAWQCAVRDRWIGWNAAQRARQLGGIVNNTRFLIFSWVRVPHLASHILSRISRRSSVSISRWFEMQKAADEVRELPTRMESNRPGWSSSNTSSSVASSPT